MKVSCNGCRILRKGCSDDCAIRPCLAWIKTPEAQANATLFLAKFYGRAGLLNLLNAGPSHLRPEIFRSLLYEACGRIVNPVHGAVGLLYSNNWARCQSAVDAVLSGSHTIQSPPQDVAEAKMPMLMPLESCDIRHLSKDDQVDGGQNQTGVKNKGKATSVLEIQPAYFTISEFDEMNLDMSKDSSIFSVETVKPKAEAMGESQIGLDLELSLGLNL